MGVPQSLRNVLIRAVKSMARRYRPGAIGCGKASAAVCASASSVTAAIWPASPSSAGAIDRHRDGIQLDAVGRFADLDVDRLRTGDRRAVEIRMEFGVVKRRNDIVRQFA
jgi:hypothetical protein